MSYSSLSTAVATLALLLLVGYLAGKAKIVDEVATQRLSALTLKVGQPFLLINSLLSFEYSHENLKTGLSVLALGIGVHALMAVIAFLLSRPIRDFDEKKVSEFAMQYGNCGFMGFPILESLFGARGLFWGAFFVISFNLFTWTWGLLILARRRPDIRITPAKILVNYATLPILIGLLIYITRIPMPGAVTGLTQYLAAICTPLSILITGANLARRKLGTMLKNVKIYTVSGVKLIFMPLLLCILLDLLGLPADMVIFAAVMAAMPCAAVSTMFNEMYHILPGYAAELVGASTLFSALTIFPVVTVAQKITELL